MCLRKRNNNNVVKINKTTKKTPHKSKIQSSQQKIKWKRENTNRKKKISQQNQIRQIITKENWTLKSSIKLATSSSSSSSLKSRWHFYSLPIVLLLLVQSQNVINALEVSGHSTTITRPTVMYSQALGAADNENNSFRPIIPQDTQLENLAQNVFTKAGQYRVFESVDTDLRATVASNKHVIDNYAKLASKLSGKHRPIEIDKSSEIDSMKFQKKKTKNSTNSAATQIVATKSKQITNDFSQPSRQPTTVTTPTGNFQTVLNSEIKGLESLLAEYVDNFFNKGQYQPKPELIMALQQNYTGIKQRYDTDVVPFLPEVPTKARPIRQVMTRRDNNELSLNIPRAFETGRLLFFAGLKKVMWPIYMGLQILKSLMFALLLPTLIGSFGKLLGKGITSGSAPLFIRPMDEPQDLDFKDNNFNFDDDSNKFSLMDDASTGVGVKDNGYAYNQAEASQTNNQYAYNAASINQHSLSRFGMNERQQLMQDSYLSALQSLGAASFKNSNGISGSSSGGLTAPMRQKPAPPANMNTFQQFQKVPTSSLLLSNYDPFYSPLLSRLDSVFAQLKLNSDNEACREKLICLMYANPAKYAPYSNLVSAQLSRELNELRKPSSDNPDILRFFKYMRAAKDGQDGIDCEESFDKCKEFKDFENPAMVSTYHDINKLVQARKLT